MDRFELPNIEMEQCNSCKGFKCEEEYIDSHGVSVMTCEVEFYLEGIQERKEYA